MSAPDMAAYLLSRIAEDEQAARAACDHLPSASRSRARRELAECEAKCRVVQLCQDAPALDDWVTTALAEEVLLHLVQVYADRHDFPPEWLSGEAW